MRSFSNVVGRHGNNPQDDLWQRAKDYIVMAWFDAFPNSQTSSPPSHRVTPTMAPPVQPPFPRLAPVPYPPSQALPTFSFPFRPRKEDVFYVQQGRVVTLSLYNIPEVGQVTLTLRNMGGVMHMEDVTNNFTTRRTLDNTIQGEGSKIQWKMKSDYATSKLPAIRKQINQMDKNAVHTFEFSLSVPGKPNPIMSWKKYMVVIGRGGTAEHESTQTLNVGWEDLQPIHTLSSPSPVSKRKRAVQEDATKADPPNPEPKKHKVDDETDEEGEEEGGQTQADVTATHVDIRKGMQDVLLGVDRPSQPQSPPNQVDEEVTPHIKEPVESFTLQPHHPTVASTITQPPIDPPRAESIHLSIRLIEMAGKTPVPWGDAVEHGTQLAVALHNPLDDRIRVVCHACDKNAKVLPMEGKLAMNLAPRETTVMSKFVASHESGPIQLHFLCAVLPLVQGRPLYHTCLFVNVKAPKPTPPSEGQNGAKALPNPN